LQVYSPEKTQSAYEVFQNVYNFFEFFLSSQDPNRNEERTNKKRQRKPQMDKEKDNEDRQRKLELRKK
jgi:hypothetical protein